MTSPTSIALPFVALSQGLRRLLSRKSNLQEASQRTNQPRTSRWRRAAVVTAAGLVPLAAGLAPLALGAGVADAAPSGCSGTTTVTCTFDSTGSAQTWTVPAGVTQATFTLYGAEGGSAFGNGPGGLGAKVTASLAVTPSSMLQVNVGQAGAVNGGASFGGGGPAREDASSGGGASDIRSAANDGSYPPANRLLVGAGGGGNGSQGSPESGPFPSIGTGGNSDSAGTAGGSVTLGDGTLGGGGGGGAGTSSAPGAGGAGGTKSGSPDCGVVPPSGKAGPGSPGGTGQSQGTGGSGATFDGGGGGGGGGYFGGGGGGGGLDNGCGNSSSGGGGGGGASYSSVADATITDGVTAPDDAPNGEVVITYTGTSGIGSGPGATNCTPGTGADLSGCNLTGATLPDATLTGANLSGAILAEANLSGATLTGANLSGANLSGATLTGATLTGADLTDVTLTDADLTGVTLTGTNLIGATLSGANLSGATLTGVISGGIIGEPSALPAGWTLVSGTLAQTS